MQIVALDFVSTLQSVLGSLFTEVLSPVLVKVFNTVVNLILDTISTLFSAFLFQIWVIILKILAYLEDIFNVFAGLTSVAVYTTTTAADGTVTSEYVSTGQSFLDYLFYTDVVQHTLWAMILVAFCLIFLTSLLATFNSMSDSVLENKHPMSVVIKDTLKATCTVISIPLVCLLMLSVMTTLILVLDQEVFNTGDTDISDTVFITMAGPAAKSDAIKTEYSSGHAYENDGAVDNFNEEKINYLYAYGITAFIAMMLLLTVFQSIQRIFMLLLLALVAPFVAVSMPIDGGKKFDDWKKLFLGYCVAGVAPIMSMQIYLVVVSGLFNSTTTIQYSTSTVVSAMVEVLLLAGGMFAIYSSRNLYVSVIDQQVARTMDESSTMLFSPISYLRDEHKEAKRKRQSRNG